jgi:hypothetical protein
MVGVGHVDAANVDEIFGHELLEHFFAIGCGTDGEDDFSASWLSLLIQFHGGQR